MDKKYQVFISSTYEDLKEERQKVCDAVLTLYQIPIGMEMFSAADEEQWEIIKSHIDTTDFYVLIIANRYGSVIKEGPDKGISYTEKEYNYAVSKGVPVLAFFISENVPVKPSFVEKGKVGKLKAFKNKVKKSREVVWWDSAEDLATRVSQSLCKEILKDKRPGWIRANAKNDSNLYISMAEDSTISIVAPLSKKAVQETIKTVSSMDEPLNEEPRIKDVDDSKTIETEIYRSYVKDIKPMIASLEASTSQYPVEIMAQMQNAFDHLARYKMFGEIEQLKHAQSHIIRAKIDGMKYSCVADEGHYSTFVNNCKRGIWTMKTVPDEIIKQETIAKKALINAYTYAGDIDSQEMLQLYEKAFIAYRKVRELIDEYVNSL